MVSTGAFCALAILTLLAVFPIAKHKEDAEATTVPATTSLSITSSKDTASVDITPTSKDGTFAISAAEDQAEFSVTTDNLTGYSVTLLGSDTSGQLVNSITGDTLDTITSNTTESDFRTGSASTYANKWGYRLNINNTTTTDFMAAPTTSTAKTIYSTNAPNTTGTSDNFTLALGARVDYEKQTGTYTNTFVLTAVGNPISYQIDYIDNYDGTATVLEQDAESNITASEFIISATNPTRSGATFKGWCYGTIDHTTNPSTCTGTTYQSGDTFTFTSIPSTGIATAELYAMWEMGDTMQSFTPEMCRTRASSGNYTLKDSRDGNEYTVRWINGNCWMTQNLRFIGDSTTDASGNTTGTMTLNPTTSDVSTTTSFNYTDLETGNAYDAAKIHIPTNAQIPTGLTKEDIGVWYNYAATSAMDVASSSNTVESSRSICPSGWRLPTQAEENAMISKQAEFGPVAGGYYYTRQGGLYATTTGEWWSSTSYTAIERYALYLNGGTLSITATNDRSRLGFYIRCTMRQTMQNFSSQDAAVMATNETKTLEDERDGQVYTVAKLGDGNVWMTRNLGIGCDGANYKQVTLTSADSNVATNFTTPNVSLAAGDYTNPRMICNATYGAWYNYSTVSAGTITGASNSDDAQYDICPKGWRLPSYSEQVGITSYASQFNPVNNGYYNVSATWTTGMGLWWSSTARTDNTRHALGYTNSFDSNEFGYRPAGFYVRCIKDDSDLLTMQEVSNEDLETLIPNAGDTVTLKDSRDGQKYKVARLADGNVWTADNLNLGAVTLSTDLTSANSNVSTTIPASTFNSWKKSSSTETLTSGEYMLVSGSDSTSNIKFGILYNYCATSAGTICSNSNANDAEYDICPKGWRLPTAGAGSEFQKLYDLYPSWSAMRNSIENGGAAFSRAGYFTSGTVDSTNSIGYYASSTHYDGDGVSMISPYLTSSSTVLITNSGRRQVGRSIRCIKNDTRTVSDITYMQQMNPQIVANTTPEVTYTLKDARDDKDYTVAKLLDGQLWMTSDLNLAGGTTLNADTSDVPTDNYYTLPASSTSISTAVFYDYTKDYVYNSGNETTDQADCYANHPCNSYYSWRVATAGGKDASGVAVTNDGYNAAYSMCPKGWRLPTSTTSNDNPQTNSNWKTGDYYRLITSYGVDLESHSSASSSNNVTTSNFDNNAGPGTIPNFLRPGYYYASNGLRSGGSDSNYWSSTNQGLHDTGGNYSYLGAYYLNFKKGSDGSYSVMSALSQSYANGFPVRCMAR